MNELSGQWVTYPAESNESGRTIIVTTRSDIEKFRDNPRFKYRLTVALPYKPCPDGMPSDADAEIMEQVTDALDNVFRKDPVAVLTEISTGDGRREWVFHTLSLHIFSKKINEAMSSLPLLPLEFEVVEDPDWEDYSEGE